jgi:hypothetical protein
MKMCRHFGRNDSGKCGFAKPGRTSEQQMVCCLPTAPCGFKHDTQMLLEFTLPDKVRQRPWAQPNFIHHLPVIALVLRTLMRIYKFFTHV